MVDGKLAAVNVTEKIIWRERRMKVNKPQLHVRSDVRGCNA
jgi:hypothetical protein